MPTLTIFEDPDCLPGSNGRLFGDPIGVTRDFLRHLRNTNPVPQKYFMVESSRGTGSGVMYRIKIFLKRGCVGFFWPATVCGLPMPYGSSSGFYPEELLPEVATSIAEACDGLQMIVGLKAQGQPVPGWSWKRYLPTVEVDVAWKSFDEYLQSFRSSYRRRIKRAMEKGGELEFYAGTGRDFDDLAYEMYRQLATGHRYRQCGDEILSRAFFAKVPLEHNYIYIKKGRGIIGWALLVKMDSDLSFLLGAFDRKTNDTHEVYKNLILAIIRQAIESGCRRVHLGQTAELAKMRMGGRLEERYLLIRHSNPVLNEIIRVTDVFNFRARHSGPSLFR